MDGVLVIDKPVGPTSHDVVTCVRRELRVSRVGHTGTLDPMASGVLPLVLGRATRLARFLSGADKVYDAVVALGAATDTFDATGERVDGTAEDGSPQPREPQGPPPGAGEIERALEAFRGTFDQTPPPYSAKRIAGSRAYELARAGRAVVPRPVPVTVHELTLTAVEGWHVRLRIHCSAGFYVRTLADALGRRLGVGGHLAALRRVRAGAFDLEQAVPLSDLPADAVSGRGFIPLDALLPELPAVSLSEDGVRRARHGNDIRPQDRLSGHGGPDHAGKPPPLVRLLDAHGALLAIAAPGSEPGLLHPAVVVV